MISKKHVGAKRRTSRRSKSRPPWRAFIHWDADCVRLSDVDDSRHPILERPGWFAVLAAELDEGRDLWHDLDVLYVGDAFDQALRARLCAPGEEFDGVRASVPAGKQAIVMLGTPTNRSRKKRDRPYLDGVLRALLTRSKPKTHAGFAGPYTGEDVAVANEGAFEPFTASVTLRQEQQAHKSLSAAATASAEPSPAETPATAVPVNGASTEAPNRISGRFKIAAPGTASPRR